MRRVLIGVLAAIVVVAMVSALWQYLRHESPHGQLRITEMSGEVTLEREDQALPVERGSVLQPQDRVATGAEGRAVLSLGGQTQIRVGPVSSLQVVGVDEAGVSIELENGALQAIVRPESGGVRVTNRGRAVLSTSGAFAVGVRSDEGADVMQISAEKGALSLSGVEPSRLEEGQQAVVVDRQATVELVPEELLLAVEWPEEARTRAETTTVSGRTLPGARVTLSGTFGVRTVTADVEGRFVAELPLAEGDNPIEVHAIDVLGHRTTVEGMLQTRDTRGPTFQGGVDYGGGR